MLRSLTIMLAFALVAASSAAAVCELNCAAAEIQKSTQAAENSAKQSDEMESCAGHAADKQERSAGRHQAPSPHGNNHSGHIHATVVATTEMKSADTTTAAGSASLAEFPAAGTVHVAISENRIAGFTFELRESPPPISSSRVLRI
ncbi:MAG: hypothetical protein ACRD5L_06735 [Bryobacteraceae bacterium]